MADVLTYSHTHTLTHSHTHTLTHSRTLVHAACRSPTPQQLQWSVRMTSLPCPQIGPSSSPAREQYLHALPRSDGSSMSRIRQPVPTNSHASCTVLASDGLVTPLARRGCSCSASTIRQPHRFGLVPPRPIMSLDVKRLVCTTSNQTQAFVVASSPQSLQGLQ